MSVVIHVKDLWLAPRGALKNAQKFEIVNSEPGVIGHNLIASAMEDKGTDRGR